jgi:hypothetical protein
VTAATVACASQEVGDDELGANADAHTVCCANENKLVDEEEDEEEEEDEDEEEEKEDETCELPVVKGGFDGTNAFVFLLVDRAPDDDDDEATAEKNESEETSAARLPKNKLFDDDDDI